MQRRVKCERERAINYINNRTRQRMQHKTQLIDVSE